MTGEQKISFGEMRAAGVRSVLIYCMDYACGHHITVPDDADRWPDELRSRAPGACRPPPGPCAH